MQINDRYCFQNMTKLNTPLLMDFTIQLDIYIRDGWLRSRSIFIHFYIVGDTPLSFRSQFTFLKKAARIALQRECILLVL